LSAIQAELREQVAVMEIATETAMVAASDIKQVALSIDKSHNSEGSTIINAQHNKPGTVTAKAVGIETWLRSAAARHPDVPIVMRFDIEGAEYGVLKQLAASGSSDSLPDI
jgi:hypothetical protein